MPLAVIPQDVVEGLLGRGVEADRVILGIPVVLPRRPGVDEASDPGGGHGIRQLRRKQQIGRDQRRDILQPVLGNEV